MIGLSEDAVFALQEWEAKQESTALYEDYLRGEHRLGDWASPKFRKKYRWALASSATNYCPSVVSAFTDGLEISSFDGDEVSEEFHAEIEQVYSMARREAWAQGDAFIVVTANEAGETFPVFQKSSSMVAFVDEENPRVVSFAAKVWQDFRGDWRMQLIYADRIESYKSSATVNKNKQILAKTRTWEEDGVVMLAGTSVPVIWLKLEAPSQFEGGISVLEPVIPIQDRYNKGVADAIVGSEGSVAPVRYFLVDEIEDEFDSPHDEAKALEHKITGGGPNVDFDDARQSILMTTANSAGQFRGPQLENVLSLQKQTLSDLVGVVRLTPWFMSSTAMQNISAETAEILSAGLRGRQRAFIRDNRMALRGMMELLGYDSIPRFEVERSFALDSSVLKSGERIEEVTVTPEETTQTDITD